MKELLSSSAGGTYLKYQYIYMYMYIQFMYIQYMYMYIQYMYISKISLSLMKLTEMLSYAFGSDMAVIDAVNQTPGLRLLNQ